MKGESPHQDNAVKSQKGKKPKRFLERNVNTKFFLSLKPEYWTAGTGSSLLGRNITCCVNRWCSGRNGTVKGRETPQDRGEPLRFLANWVDCNQDTSKPEQHVEPDRKPSSNSKAKLVSYWFVPLEFVRSSRIAYRKRLKLFSRPHASRLRKTARKCAESASKTLKTHRQVLINLLLQRAQPISQWNQFGRCPLHNSYCGYWRWAQWISLSAPAGSLGRKLVAWRYVFIPHGTRAFRRPFLRHPLCPCERVLAYAGIKRSWRTLEIYIPRNLNKWTAITIRLGAPPKSQKDLVIVAFFLWSMQVVHLLRCTDSSCIISPLLYRR